MLKQGTTYLVQVTYEYVETYEVFEVDEEIARLSHEAGLSEHVTGTPPQVKRVRVVAKEA